MGPSKTFRTSSTLSRKPIASMTTPSPEPPQTAAATSEAGSGEKTEVGSYFISNYPPYSFWSADELDAARSALNAPARTQEPLGLYLHIPFCRKRCKFCYFRVYTDKNSKDVERYVAALTREIEMYAALPGVESRPFHFVYFGGGTPSFLSSKQLVDLVARLRRSIDWDDAREVTFECEPGTLTEKKLEAIREIGVTRLSLGVESYLDSILEENGRAHRSAECFVAYEQARRIGFDQINIDLIAGMVGETDENWRRNVDLALDMAPDCLTIYQMELPYNTVYSREGAGGSGMVADWRQKRAWVDYAFSKFRENGYTVSSAYTVVKSPDTRFVYRNALFNGADLVGSGVASFGHFQGAHVQNLDRFEDYLEAVEAGRLPLSRAYRLSDTERLIREFILLLKTGAIERSRFRDKFGVDPAQQFAAAIEQHVADGLLELHDDRIAVTPTGLLRIDSLLEPFFLPAHRNARYT